ncbi:E3 ubiquitin-protein ligase Zswim2 [Entophlyctis luteolus]|nr:E3 ubiquitin-protein ligase Zswim2 [Entophlyctis luteolus]KAJ3390278.1 E3 ubiquitin-protein ligase Zswim2 [Entophlyctis sp. JEL0112]
MLRSAPYRRACPEIIKSRIEDAAKLHFYVVQELGPMAFVLKEAHVRPPPDTSDTPASEKRDRDKSAEKCYKVSLGSFQSCSCRVYLTENDICVHILWVMLKVFRAKPDNEMLYQNSLIEREISELMELRKPVGFGLAISTETLKVIAVGDDADGKVIQIKIEKGHVKQREIAEGDICPICMEDLDVRLAAITYCKLSCGNNLHVKCMKILMDHQAKNMGYENIKCPLCRKDFGKYEDLKKEFNEGMHAQIKLESQSKHYGWVAP